ncbi:MAG: hypothetical protein ISQ22_07130 [Rhizobiales bacterium]|nr:hypothetical protein [Hyphomicrobiales bacterium]
MRANEFILERVTGTIDPRTGDVDMVNQRTGKTTQLRKDTMTTQDDSGKKVYRGGTLRSVSTPKIGGFQATQTFRPDSTPGYGKVDYETGGLSVSAKGSPETGYDQSARLKMGGMDIGTTQKYSGQKSMDIGYELAPGKKIRAKVTQSQFEDVQAAIREHIKMSVPFTECMFRAGSPAFTEFYRQVREVADKLNLDWQDQELLTTDIGECIMVEGELVPLDVPMEVIEEELDERKENPFQMDLTAYDFPADKDNSKYADPDDPDRDYNKKTVSIQAQLRKSVSMNGAKQVEFTNGQVVKVPRNIAMTVLKKIDDIQTTQEKFKIIKIISKSYEHLVAFANDTKVTEAEYQGRKVKLNSPKRGGSKKFYVYVKNPKTGRVKKISWGDTTGLSVKAKDRGAVRSFVARHKCKQANDKMTARYWSCRTPRYKALGVKGGQWW